MNRFDGLMIYSLIHSIFNYSIADELRMKGIKTQKTAARNLT